VQRTCTAINNLITLLLSVKFGKSQYPTVKYCQVFTDKEVAAIKQCKKKFLKNHKTSNGLKHSQSLQTKGARNHFNDSCYRSKTFEDEQERQEYLFEFYEKLKHISLVTPEQLLIRSSQGIGGVSKWGLAVRIIDGRIHSRCLR